MPQHKNPRAGDSNVLDLRNPPSADQIDWAALLHPIKNVNVAPRRDVWLTRLEKEIVDTEDFQRLRGIRQLGIVYMVYPTALHTRFDHSLGSLDMAIEMIDHIKRNTPTIGDRVPIEPAHEVLIRLYALLHDITHIPFGHTIEDELQIFQRHDKNPERISRFVGKDSAIAQLIRHHAGNEIYRRFLKIFTWHEPKRSDENPKRVIVGDPDSTCFTLDGDEFVYDLVSNTICADLLDYIQRDSVFCRLNIDLEYRVLNAIYIHRERLFTDENLEKPLPPMRRVFVSLYKEKAGKDPEIRPDILSDLARLLEARYYIAERVYFHHTKITAGAMLGRAIQEARDAKLLKEEELYNHTDDTLLWTLMHSEKAPPIAKKLARAVWTRRLYKCIEIYREESFAERQRRSPRESVVEAVSTELAEPEHRKALEDGVAAYVLAGDGDVLLYAVPRGGNLKPAETKIYWEGKQIALRNITHESTRLRLDATLKAHELLWGVYVLVDPEVVRDESKVAKIKKACRIQFCTAPREQEAERRNFYGEIVDEYLVSHPDLALPAAGEHGKMRANVVEELMRTASDKRAFKGRLEAAVEKFYPGLRQG